MSHSRSVAQSAKPRFAVATISGFYDDGFESVAPDLSLEEAMKARDSFNQLNRGEQVAVVIAFEPRFADENAFDESRTGGGVQ